jgi:hypothetical protein
MLVDIYDRLGRTLQSEYAITYRSPSSLRDGMNRTIRVTLTGAASGAEVYNPGGVVPEVPQEAASTIFLVGLAALLGLLVLPGAAGWVLGRASGWMPRRRPAARVRLHEQEPVAVAPRSQTRTRIRLRS